MRILSDTQRVLLAHAATRDDGRVQPTPTTINKNAGAITLSLRAMLTAGLITEMPAAPGDVRWGISEDGHPTALGITTLGLEAIGVTAAGDAESDSPTAPALSSAPRDGSKLALLIDSLTRPGGANLDELVSATGWQKHSVRGAISGTLKAKRKLEVTCEIVEGKGRVYRVSGINASAATANAAPDQQ